MTTRGHRGLYRALLGVFPSGFRREFGPDMEQLFADRMRDERARAWGAARLWVLALIDLASQAAREWSTHARAVARAIWEEGTRMDGWRQDLRFGLRTLLRRPGFTSAAVATLALGIGATVSIFTVVNGVLLTPLPFPEPERLVTIWAVDTQRGGRGSVDHPDIRTWQADVPQLDVAGYSGTRPTLTGLGRPEVVSGARVTDGLVTIMGYEPMMGRDLTAADDVPGGPDIVVISHSFWVDRLGRDPDVLGRTLTLSASVVEIVGVAPPGFDYPDGSDFWMPRHHQTDGCGHGCRLLRGVGRLRPEATLESAQSAMDAVSARLADEYPDSHRDSGALLEPMLDTEVANVRTGLWVLFGAVGMVLLIACANVANLMLVRAAQRREEVALRLSLGASRARVVRQLLTESLLLAGLAGIAGLALSAWGTRALVRMAPDTLPRLEQAGLDPTVVAFTALLVVVVTSLFGMMPALQLSRHGLRDDLGTVGRAAGRRRSGMSRSILVAGEVGLSLALLLGAGLLFRTLIEIRSVDYGFAVDGSERFRMSIPDSRYDSLGVGRFLGELEDRIAAVPGVVAVGSGFGVPLASGSISTSVGLLDRPEVAAADKPDLAIRPSSPGLLRASGMRLVAGRWFTDDDVYGSEPVGVINETAVRLHYPDADPIGRRIQADVSWGFEDTPPLTIVGVVGDVRGSAATDDPEGALYLPNAQFGANSVYVWLRRRGGVPTVMPEVRAILDDIDPELAITNETTIDAVVEAEQQSPRFYLTLLSLFSVLALVLATIGLYGVVAYSVSQRTREIGIRMALGAEADRVVGMVARQSVPAIVGGVVLGLALSFLGGRALESLLYGVDPQDPLTMAATSLLLLAVTGAATLLPARRASRIPPGQALRND